MTGTFPWWLVLPGALALCCTWAAPEPLALASPPTTPTAAQLAQGEAVYARCLACHSLERDRTGPRHCGLMGRRSGTLPGYGYSEAMVAAGIVWTPETLDAFLAHPTSTVPDTTMTFAGVPDPAERHALIAWLQVATADPTLCPEEAPP